MGTARADVTAFASKEIIMSVDVIYRTKATATGGRDGSARSDDGSVDVKLVVPKEMGGPGGEGANPEKLFAAGYSACFLGAMKAVSGKEGVRAGIKSGFGIGLLGRSNLEEGLTELHSDLPAMPSVSHVLRSRAALPSRLERNFADAVLLEMKQDIGN